MINMKTWTWNKHNLLTTLFFGLLCFLTYSNSLNAPFMMDDHALITRNVAIYHPLKYTQLDLKLSFAGEELGPNDLYFRPVSHGATFVIFNLFGPNPFMFHVINLCFFFLGAVAFFELLNNLHIDRKLSLLAAALLIVHPIFGILVNYKTATGYVILLGAYNISLLAYVRYLANSKKLNLIASLLFYIIALLCHETAIVLPFYLAAILYFKKDTTLKKTFQSLIPFLMIFFGYLIFRMYYASLKIGIIDQVGKFEISPLSYLATLANLILFYFKNLTLLTDIVLIWSTPIIQNYIWLYASLLITLTLFGIRLVFISKDKNQALALSWILIGLAPLAMACFARRSTGLIISTHWLIYSSVGFIFLLAIILFRILQNRKWIASTLIVLIIGGYFSASRIYNRLWNNEEKYCQYMLKLSPQLVMPTWWLADYYLTNQNYEKAKTYFRQAFRGVHSDWKILLNLGIIEGAQGNEKNEMEFYRRSLWINPQSSEALSNMAVVHMRNHHFKEAKKLLLKAIEYNPYSVYAMKNLSHLYAQEKNWDESKKWIDQAAVIDPYDPWIQNHSQHIQSNSF